jgi:hypothetical protein
MADGGTRAQDGSREKRVRECALAELADGLLQWRQTRGLIEARLGPTALAQEHVDLLRERLRAAGITVAREGPE